MSTDMACGLFSMVARCRAVFWKAKNHRNHAQATRYPTLLAYPVLIDLIEQMRVHRVQQLNGLGVTGHGGQLQRITSGVIAMQQCATIEQQLHHPSVSLLRGNVQRSHSGAVALVDDERTLLGVEQLSHRIVASKACGKV